MINLHINFDYTGIFYQGLLLLFAPRCGSVQVNFLFKYPLAFFDIGDGKMCPIFVGWTLRNSSRWFSPKLFVNLKEMKPFVYINFPQKTLQNFASKSQTCKIQLPTYETLFTFILSVNSC